MTSIFDDRQSTALCNFKKRIEVRGMSGIVNRKNCFCAWRDQRLDSQRIKIERIGVNISENRLAALIENAVRSCGKRKRSRDGFIASFNARGKCGSMQRGRPTAETDRMTRTHPSGKCVFELWDLWSSSQPV